MRLVVQRVSAASVSISGALHSSIGQGLLVLAGIETRDTSEDVSWLSAKLCGLRIFSDDEGKMNLDLRDVQGELMIISQFTLHASTKKGNRPSFINAARPEQAIPLYEQLVETCASLIGKPCATGVFGADMQVSLVNDGPVTIVIDSRNKE